MSAKIVFKLIVGMTVLIYGCDEKSNQEGASIVPGPDCHNLKSPTYITREYLINASETDLLIAQFQIRSCNFDDKYDIMIYEEQVRRNDPEAMYFYAMKLYESCNTNTEDKKSCISYADYLVKRSAKMGIADAIIEAKSRNLY